MCILRGSDSHAAALTLRGHIYIPAIALDEPVVAVYPVVNKAKDEFDQYVIDDGVDWLSDTAWIDTPGRVVLAGHTPGVFEDLHRLQKGDQIVVYDEATIVTYQITGVFIEQPSVYQWMRETSDARILLITCAGDWRLVIEGMKDD